MDIAARTNAQESLRQPPHTTLEEHDMDTNEQGTPYQRTEEEVVWDAEFGTPSASRDSNVPGVLADLAKLAIQVPVAIVQMPLAMLPDDTARHARSAVREGFLAVRSLLGAIGDGIENLLADPSAGKSATVAGPPGTWGTGRQATSTSKLKRIEVQDEVSEKGSVEPGTGVNIDDLGNSQEGRGLRADIDY
jgi:hypothetical protein